MEIRARVIEFMYAQIYIFHGCARTPSDWQLNTRAHICKVSSVGVCLHQRKHVCEFVCVHFLQMRIPLHFPSENIILWWSHDMLNAILDLCQGLHRSLLDSYHKRPVKCGDLMVSLNLTWNRLLNNMMTPSNVNIIHVIGPLCGGFTGHRWIPLTKASEAEILCFLWPEPWINGWLNNREAGVLRRHRAHYDVIVMNNLVSGDLGPYDAYVTQLCCLLICHVA